MDMRVDTPMMPPPVDRAWAVSMVIRSFKGRRDVEVHLYRAEAAPDPGMDGGYDWDALLGELPPNAPAEPEATKRMILESFTEAERDQVLDFLTARYEDRLVSITATPMEFPLPKGLPPLSSFPEGKSVGRIYFEKIPTFDLGFVIHGLYDLARHKPLVEEQE